MASIPEVVIIPDSDESASKSSLRVILWEVCSSDLQEPDEIDALVKGPHAPAPSELEVVKDAALVTGRFIKTLLQKLPDVAEGNPVKAALGIVKLILDISDVSCTDLR